MTCRFCCFGHLNKQTKQIIISNPQAFEANAFSSGQVVYLDEKNLVAQKQSRKICQQKKLETIDTRRIYSDIVHRLQKKVSDQNMSYRDRPEFKPEEHGLSKDFRWKQCTAALYL